MECEWGVKLQADYPFMDRARIDDERNIYCSYGFECEGGWYQLLDECCDSITELYARRGIEPDAIDLVPNQIKEKYGTLRFYYSYKESSVDSKTSNNSADDQMRNLREEINDIISSFEILSSHICERCGSEGSLRDIAGCHRTLCGACFKEASAKE